MTIKIDESKRRRRGRGVEQSTVRNHTVSSRMNDAELAVIDSFCGQANMQRGEYLRCSLLNLQPLVPPSINKDDRRLLANIANNINQVAKAANSGKVEDVDTSTFAETLDLIRQIRVTLITGKMPSGDDSEEGETCDGF